MMRERQDIEVNFDGMYASFLEPKVNHVASNYLSEHYDEICRQTRRMHVHPDQVGDLVSDVWTSIRDAELRGEGYDVSHSNEGDIITVEEFIFGRIKGYSMNSKYRNDATERHTSKDTAKSVEIVSASCGDASDLDNLDGFQKAYALAASYDAIEDVDAELSLRSNIQFCVTFNDAIGFNLINFFKHMDMISTVSFNCGLFDQLKNIMNKREDFRDAFKEIMLVAARSKPVFESVVSTI